MLLSVIIPAFNEEKVLGKTLDRIRSALEANGDLDFTWEIIVCDNNSDDRTAEFARERGAVVVSEPENQISKARNAGANKAQGEWFLFIDADSYPLPALIRETIQLTEAVDVIGCSSTIKVVGGPLWYRFRLESHNMEMRLFKSCVGVYLLCEADAFRSIGGFSSELFALEELEFAKRLKAYGRKGDRRFKVLHRHPVITSGRKGALHSKRTIAKSVCLALWSLISRRPIKSKNSLPYWYENKR